MSKLLSADFARLKKDKLFWIGTIFMFAMGVLSPVMNYIDMKHSGYEISLDNIFFIYAIYIGILLSAFCSLFIGTDYSDGTIRNKVVIGHTRNSVYLSHFIVCAAAGMLMCLAYIVPGGVLGICLLGFFETDIQLVLGLILCSVIMSLAFTAVFSLVAMLNQNKAVVAVINILGVFILLFGAIYIRSKLYEPEIYDGYVYRDENGEIVEVEAAPNPGYIRGTEREVYTFFYDFLPTCQSLQLSSMQVERLWRVDLYSAAITIVATGAGLFFFRKKDLK